MEWGCRSGATAKRSGDLRVDSVNRMTHAVTYRNSVSDSQTVSEYRDIKRESRGICRIVWGMAKSQHAARYKYLPSLLLRMREDAGMTQRDLARKLRMPQPWVHKSETGERRVDVAEFMDWCLACGTDPESGLRLLREQRGL